MTQSPQIAPLLALIDTYLTRIYRYFGSLHGTAKVRYELLRQVGKLRHRLWLVQSAQGQERERMLRFFFKWRG